MLHPYNKNLIHSIASSLHQAPSSSKTEGTGPAPFPPVSVGPDPGSSPLPEGSSVSVGPDLGFSPPPVVFGSSVESLSLGSSLPPVVFGSSGNEDDSTDGWPLEVEVEGPAAEDQSAPS